MKKLTRKSLDELALVMPLINEIQQRECVGGTVYFDSNGNRVGEFGSGSEIKVLNDSQTSNFEMAKVAFNAGESSFTVTGNVSGNEDEEPIPNSTTFNLTNFGESLNGQDNNTKLNVFKYYAKNYCSNADEVSMNISGSMAAGVWTQPSTGKKHLEVNPNQSFNFDERSIKSVMKHESLHLTNPNDNEATNIMNEGKTDEFKNSTPGYKANEAKYLYDEWKNEDRNTNKTLADACTLLGASYQLASKLQ